MANPWTYRQYAPEDVPAISKWWIGSFRRSKWAGTLPNNKASEYIGETISQLLSRGAKCTLAVNPSNPAQILGFLVTERTSKDEPVVHYVFTKDIYRRRGVSKALLAEEGIKSDGTTFYTHRTAYSKWYRGKHVPEIARRKKA